MRPGDEVPANYAYVDPGVVVELSYRSDDFDFRDLALRIYAAFENDRTLDNVFAGSVRVIGLDLVDNLRGVDLAIADLPVWVQSPNQVHDFVK